MFERYSEKAKRVIFFARYETSQFGSPVIDTEHLLLGILRVASDSISSIAGVAAVDAIREQIQLGSPVREKISTSIDLPFSEAAKHVLESAMEEADLQDSRAIVPEHILIGLLRREGCLAHRILVKQGVTLESLYRRDGGGEKATEILVGGRITGKAVPSEEFRKLVADAINEASLLHSTVAKPEHLLLGLLHDESSLAASILREAGLNYGAVRDRVKKS
jgi:ATP-dependent Clp protease ATP-binding subunit ClpC